MNVARMVRAAVRSGTLLAVPALAVAGLVTPARADVVPTISITSLTDGASVHGTVTVTATGTTDAVDGAQLVYLFVDGALLTDFACPGQDSTCDASFEWDTTLLTGAHTLQASLTTTSGVVVDGPVLTVTADNPAPAVSIVSPTPGTVVQGIVDVAVTGSTEAAASDLPDHVDLLLDGNVVATDLCGDADPHRCSMTLQVDTTGLFGRHTLAARFSTTANRTSTTTADVWVYGGTTSTVSVSRAVRAGAATVVRGRVTGTADGSPVAGATVLVTLAPAVGTARTLTVQTSSTGIWSATMNPATNTRVTAAVVASDRYGASSATATQLVIAPISTSLSRTTAPRNVWVSGTATVKYLPAGTRLSLQAYYGGRWHSLAAGAAPGPRFGFRVRFAAAGRYSIRVVTGVNRVYTVTSGPSVRLTVR